MTKTQFEDSMLTTCDNNFSPFTNYEEWKKEDERLGHYTEQLIAAFAVIPYETSEKDYEQAIEDAIDEIIDTFPNIYLRIYRT